MSGSHLRGLDWTQTSSKSSEKASQVGGNCGPWLSRESEGREHVFPQSRGWHRREITGVRPGGLQWFRPIQRALGKHGWFLSDSKLFKANCKSPSEMLGRYGWWDQE